MSETSLCDGLDGIYSIGLHVGAIIIVLGSSALGACIPTITKFIPTLRDNPFFFVVAKTAATGVLLSVSCIHLINDAVKHFEEPCINKKFREFYSGYALFFALVAALFMHAVDLQLAAVTERWMRMRAVQGRKGVGETAAQEPVYDSGMNGGRASDGAAIAPASGTAAGGVSPRREVSATAGGGGGGNEEGVLSKRPTFDAHGATCAVVGNGHVLSQTAEQPAGSCLPGGRAMTHPPTAGAGAAAESSTEAWQHGQVASARSDRRAGERRIATSHGADLEVAFSSRDKDEHAPTSPRAGHHGAAEVTEELLESHGHSHAIVLPPSEFPQIRRVIAAICMEFGVTLHSIFVGLDIGLTSDSTLRPLLVALVFHQLFEGISLGSRLVDAKFKTALEVVLALVFSVSAPIGMTVSTIAVSIRKDAMVGGGFVLMMAVLSSFCGGILLYLAFSLLLTDFQEELKIYGTAAHPWRRVAMFLALWIGMVAMSIVGKWL